MWFTVYIRPHNCPTIWAGAKSCPKEKAGRNKTASFDVEGHQGFTEETASEPGFCQMHRSQEAPCQGRGVRVNLLGTQTMVWNRGGAIWRDGEARRIVGGHSGREIRARAGVHLSHSEPVLVYLRPQGLSGVRSSPRQMGSRPPQAVTQGPMRPRLTLYAPTLPSMHPRRPVPNPWTPSLTEGPKDCGQEGPLEASCFHTTVWVQSLRLCSSST